MASLEAWTAKLPIYKDQTSSSNYNKKIEVGDSVTLVIRNDAGAETTQVVTATAVLDGGRTIQWNPGTTGIRTFDIVRTHQKHQVACFLNNYAATLAEVATEALLMSVGTVTIGGGVYDINITETGPGADGIPPAFAQAVVDKMNMYLGKVGTASYSISGTAGSQVLTLRIDNIDIPWTAITTTNATTAQPIPVV